MVGDESGTAENLERGTMSEKEARDARGESAAQTEEVPIPQLPNEIDPTGTEARSEGEPAALEASEGEEEDGEQVAEEQQVGTPVTGRHGYNLRSRRQGTGADSAERRGSKPRWKY